jgi:hypothetical protein
MFRVILSGKFFIRGDLNGHVGLTIAGFEIIHGGFGYVVRIRREMKYRLCGSF